MAGKGGVLAGLDLSLKLTSNQEEARIVAAQERLLQLRLVLGGLIGKDPQIGPPVCVVFEGWEMLDRTDHPAAPWVLVEAEDKRWARVKVVESVVSAIEAGMAVRNIPVPPPP